MVARELERAAASYLHNADNRGIFDRSGYFAGVAGDGEDVGVEHALEYLLSADFRAGAEQALRDIAPKWERWQSRPPQRILDAGSGPGVTTLALARRYEGAEVIGIDVEPHALGFARALARDFPQVSFAEAPIERFEAGDGFDLVQCRMVIEHVFDPADAVGRIARMLRPGGLAYLEFPNYLWPWEPHVQLPMLPKSPKWLLAAECRLTGREPDFVHHLNFQCDPLALRRWIRRSGAEVEIIDLMAEKVRAVFDGQLDPAVSSRGRAVAWVRGRPRLRRLVVNAMERLPIAPSVMVLLRRPEA